MKIIPYPAHITYDKTDKSYVVEFRDLPGCLTEGVTLDEAKENAKEALTGWIASTFERGFVVPKPSAKKGKDIYLIKPEAEVAVSILLRAMREEMGFTQVDAAKLLHISYQSYQRLENPSRSNPTIKTLTKVAHAYGRDIDFEFA